MAKQMTPPAAIRETPPATEKPKATRTAFEIRRPPVVNGHYMGAIIKNGVARTEDPAIAARCAEGGCQVSVVEIDE